MTHAAILILEILAGWLLTGGAVWTVAFRTLGLRFDVAGPCAPFA